MTRVCTVAGRKEEVVDIGHPSKGEGVSRRCGAEYDSDGDNTGLCVTRGISEGEGRFFPPYSGGGTDTPSDIMEHFRAMVTI